MRFTLYDEELPLTETVGAWRLNQRLTEWNVWVWIHVLNAHRLFALSCLFCRCDTVGCVPAWSPISGLAGAKRSSSGDAIDRPHEMLSHAEHLLAVRR